MSDLSSPWDIVVKIAVDAAGEAEARSVVDLVVRAMEITAAAPPPFVRFDDGTWVTEIRVAEPAFEDTGSGSAGLQSTGPEGAMSVLSSLKANLGPVTWRGVSDTPFDPDSASAGQIEWPPGFWALAGRRETLVHPSVRAMLMQARRIRPQEAPEDSRPFP